MHGERPVRQEMRAPPSRTIVRGMQAPISHCRRQPPTRRKATAPLLLPAPPPPHCCRTCRCRRHQPPPAPTTSSRRSLRHVAARPRSPPVVAAVGSLAWQPVAAPLAASCPPPRPFLPVCGAPCLSRTPLRPAAPPLPPTPYSSYSIISGSIISASDIIEPNIPARGPLMNVPP